MVDRVLQLSNRGQLYSTPPAPSTQPSTPADENSVPLLVRLKDMDISHIFITVGLNTSLDALKAQVLAAFRQLDVNNLTGIPSNDGVSALEIRWLDAHDARFPATTVFTAANTGPLLFFLKRRASRDAVEVITRNQELSGRYR